MGQDIIWENTQPELNSATIAKIRENMLAPEDFGCLIDESVLSPPETEGPELEDIYRLIDASKTKNPLSQNEVNAVLTINEPPLWPTQNATTSLALEEEIPGPRCADNFAFRMWPPSDSDSICRTINPQVVIPPPTRLADQSDYFQQVTFPRPVAQGLNGVNVTARSPYNTYNQIQTPAPGIYTAITPAVPANYAPAFKPPSLTHVGSNISQRTEGSPPGVSVTTETQVFPISSQYGFEPEHVEIGPPKVVAGTVNGMPEKNNGGAISELTAPSWMAEPKVDSAPQGGVLVTDVVPTNAVVETAGGCKIVAAPQEEVIVVEEEHIVDMGNQPRLRYSKGAAPSKYCHVCGRSADTVTVAHCANTRLGLCRKVLCDKCLIIHQTGSANWARENNTSWTCTHCRGVCPYRARCHQYTRNNMRRRVKNDEKRKADKNAKRKLAGEGEPVAKRARQEWKKGKVAKASSKGAVVGSSADDETKKIE